VLEAVLDDDDVADVSLVQFVMHLQHSPRGSDDGKKLNDTQRGRKISLTKSRNLTTYVRVSLAPYFLLVRDLLRATRNVFVWNLPTT
jgi:hypothetical protein